MLTFIAVLLLVLLCALLCWLFPSAARRLRGAVEGVEVDWCDEQRGPIRW